MNMERQLLLRAIDEIGQLRLANQILAAKVEVVEIFRDAIRGSDKRGYNSCSEDLLWRLQQRADELAAADGNSRETQQHI
jgi:hypothetical protein